jgi:hypothetical protein
MFQIRRAWQFVAFISALAARFPDVTTVQMAVDYLGLKRRCLDDPSPRHIMGIRPSSNTNHRRVTVETSVDALAGDGVTEAAMQLVAPVLRLFDGFEVARDYVSSRLHE